MRTGFDMRKFKTLTTHKEQLSYAKSKLKVLGSGSSRIAFLLNNRTVLKMAPPAGRYDDQATQRGWAQNDAEVDAFTNPKMQPILAKLYDFDKVNYNWVIAELVRPLSEKEFYRRIGIGSSGVAIMASIYINDANGDLEKAKMDVDEDIERDQKKLDSAKAKLAAAEKALAAGESSKALGTSNITLKRDWVKFAERQLEKEKEVRNALHSEFFQLVTELEIEFGIISGDTMLPEHWGNTADGRVVLLDYGFTKDVSAKLYQR